MELMINKIITQKAAATHTSKQMLDKLYLKSAYTLSLFVLKNALPWVVNEWVGWEFEYDTYTWRELFLLQVWKSVNDSFQTVWWPSTAYPHRNKNSPRLPDHTSKGLNEPHGNIQIQSRHAGPLDSEKKLNLVWTAASLYLVLIGSYHSLYGRLWRSSAACHNHSGSRSSPFEPTRREESNHRSCTQMTEIKTTPKHLIL